MAIQILYSIRRAMLRVMSLMTPSCKEVSRLVSDSMDRKLSLGVRIKIRIHLGLCSLCRRYRRQLVYLRRGVHLHAERSGDLGGLSSTAKMRLKEALREKGH